MKIEYIKGDLFTTDCKVIKDARITFAELTGGQDESN